MQRQEINLNKIKNAYFIGIKGVGMTALAQVLHARGINVSGSDTHEKFFTDEVLRNLNISVHEGFRKRNIPKNADLVVSSTAFLNTTRGGGVASKNTEVQEILKRGIAILTYPEALGLLFREYYGIAVAGTHGKSTTTAMLGVILEKARFDPTVIVGTRVNQWGTNARASTRRVRPPSVRGGSDPPLFVAEADEYREAFLHYEPKGLIITSIEYDHPDYFKTFRAYKSAFRKLVKKIPHDGFIVANWDDQRVREVVQSARCKVIPYRKNQQKTFKIHLRIPGEFNIANAIAAFTAARALGVPTSTIKKALAGFQGTARRFEIKSTSPTIIDDYAHHPTEIQVTLKAARELWPKQKIWAIFQPHTFSRTEALLDEFARSFGDADEVIILETYGSARETRGQVGSDELVKKIRKAGKSARRTSSVRDAAIFLRKKIIPSDVILTMGAGNVWEVGEILTK